jgi:hypothetical protein
MRKLGTEVVVAVIVSVWGHIGQAQDPRPRPTPPSAQALSPAPSATLLITVDAAAQLAVDGEALGAVSAKEVRRVPVRLGQHLMQAASTDEAGVDIRQTVDVKAAGPVVVTLSLAAGVAEVRRARAKEETRRAEAEAVRAKEDAFARRFQVKSETVIMPETGLEWAGRDNGSDITWTNATAYCEALTLGGFSGWRLPSVEEMGALYRAVESRPLEELSCGGPWHPVPGVRASCFWFWSGTRTGASEASSINFSDGRRHAFHVVDFNTRALCVRRAGG